MCDTSPYCRPYGRSQSTTSVELSANGSHRASPRRRLQCEPVPTASVLSRALANCSGETSTPTKKLSGQKTAASKSTMPFPTMGSTTTSPERGLAVAPSPQAVAWWRPLCGKVPFLGSRCKTGRPTSASRGLTKTKTCIVGAMESCLHPSGPRTSYKASRTFCFTTSPSSSRTREPFGARRRQSTCHRQTAPAATPWSRDMCWRAEGQSASRTHCCNKA
mmetsp:Transcript_98528/g.303716  ORF Transcript_98528/g.303716 Transcript_98528/m.303716 type:complete len:219 (+) Transcript_98528:174-830(+)